MDELKVVESGSLNVIPVTEYDPFEVCTFYFVHATLVKFKKNNTWHFLASVKWCIIYE